MLTVFLTLLLAATITIGAVVCIRQAAHTRRLRARIAELEGRLVAKGKEPAIISHEIRTPLALIRGAGELLADETPGPLTARQKEFVRTITENTELVSGIAENSLTSLYLSNLAEGELQRNQLDVRAVVADAAKQVRRITDVPIYVDAIGGLLPLTANERLVRQLVWNLLSNAVRHSDPQQPVVVRVEDGASGGVHLVVTDSGAGMLPEDLANLFVPFYTGSSRRAGTGIGMMVSQQIVLAHGGEIWVDSTAEVGTAVHVMLPSGNMDSERSEKR